jgi:hypothetical protein
LLSPSNLDRQRKLRGTKTTRQNTAAKKPRPLGSRGFAADTEGLHSGTAQAAIQNLARSQDSFGLGPDISATGEPACSAKSSFRRLALPCFRLTRSARSSHASAIRRRRVLSASTAARFDRSRHAAANRRYSNSKLTVSTQSTDAEGFEKRQNRRGVPRWSLLSVLLGAKNFLGL